MESRDVCIVDGGDRVSRSSYYNPGSPKAPVAWHGGKHYYARDIIRHFPQHRVHVEPYVVRRIGLQS